MQHKTNERPTNTVNFKLEHEYYEIFQYKWRPNGNYEYHLAWKLTENNLCDESVLKWKYILYTALVFRINANSESYSDVRWCNSQFIVFHYQNAMKYWASGHLSRCSRFLLVEFIQWYNKGCFMTVPWNYYWEKVIPFNMYWKNIW